MQEERNSVVFIHTPVPRALSTEIFHQSHLHYNLSAVIHQKGAYNSLFLVIYRYKKTKFLRIFGNFRELLENFRHFKKNLRALFWEIPERILDIFSGIM